MLLNIKYWIFFMTLCYLCTQFHLFIPQHLQLQYWFRNRSYWRLIHIPVLQKNCKWLTVTSIIPEMSHIRYLCPFLTRDALEFIKRQHRTRIRFADVHGDFQCGLTARSSEMTV